MGTTASTHRSPAITVRRDTELGTWQQIRLPPSAPLRGLVQDFHGYAQRVPAGAVHRAGPMPGVPIIITLGPPHVIRSRTGEAVQRWSFVAGPHDRHVFVEADAFVGMQANLSPLGAYRLLGRGLRELTDHVVSLDDVLGPAAERLVDDLACAAGWGERIRLLDAALQARLAMGPAPSPQVAWAFERLRRSRGNVAVATLADELGWSRRHLTARFSEQVGLSPKRMGRLIRYHHAVELLERPDGPGLAEVALLAGYYDQAHLANEVRAHCGMSPSQVRARVLAADHGAFEPPDTRRA